MVTVDSIKEYWRTSELNAIADYDGDGIFDDAVVQSAIDDAYREIEPLNEYHPIDSIDLFAKRLTICILLSRLNINPEAVMLPLDDCKKIQNLITKVLTIKTDNKASVDLRPASSGVNVSQGTTPLSDILDTY